MTTSDTKNMLPLETLLIDTLLGAADTAARAIPPVWPLASSVAVNPFLGQTSETLADGADCDYAPFVTLIIFDAILAMALIKLAVVLVSSRSWSLVAPGAIKAPGKGKNTRPVSVIADSERERRHGGGGAGESGAGVGGGGKHKAKPRRDMDSDSASGDYDADERAKVLPGVVCVAYARCVHRGLCVCVCVCACARARVVFVCRLFCLPDGGQRPALGCGDRTGWTTRREYPYFSPPPNPPAAVSIGRGKRWSRSSRWWEWR